MISQFYGCALNPAGDFTGYDSAFLVQSNPNCLNGSSAALFNARVRSRSASNLPEQLPCSSPLFVLPDTASSPATFGVGTGEPGRRYAVGR